MSAGRSRRQAAASARSATPVECSRSHGVLRSVNAAMATKAASTRSPAIRICGNGSISSACSQILVSSISARIASRCCRASSGEPRVVRGARAVLDDEAGFFRPGGREEHRDVAGDVEDPHRQRDRLAARHSGEAVPVPALEHVSERCLGSLAEAEPGGEALCHLAVHCERLASHVEPVQDRLLDHHGAFLVVSMETDARLEELDDLAHVARVDERERCPRRDVVAVQLGGLVAVRRAAGGVEERGVVGVDELLLRRACELTEPYRDHGGTQRVLERLTGAEVGREREGADDLRRANRLLDRGLCRPCSRGRCRHAQSLCTRDHQGLTARCPPADA